MKVSSIFETLETIINKEELRLNHTTDISWNT